MPKTDIAITAAFRHAEKTDMGWSFMPFDEPVLTVTLEASRYPDIEAEVKRLVADHIKHHCSVHLRLPRGLKRKPNGWDKFTRGLQFIECDA